MLLGSPSVFMVRKMLIKVKQVSEGRQSRQLIDRAVGAIGVWSPEARRQPLGINRQ